MSHALKEDGASSPGPIAGKGISDRVARNITWKQTETLETTLKAGGPQIDGLEPQMVQKDFRFFLERVFVFRSLLPVLRPGAISRVAAIGQPGALLPGNCSLASRTGLSSRWGSVA